MTVVATTGLGEQRPVVRELFNQLHRAVLVALSSAYGAGHAAGAALLLRLAADEITVQEFNESPDEDLDDED